MRRVLSCAVAALLASASALADSGAGELPACPAARPAAGESYAAFATRIHRRDCAKPWTILVYMAAENDLAPDALWDLYEMEAGYKTGLAAAGSTDQLDLLVQLELPGVADARRLHVFQQQSEIYDDRLTIADFQNRLRTPGAGILSPVAGLQPRSEGGHAVPAATEFERFVAWGLATYPSTHTMVVVWGHGQGWAPNTAFAGRHFGGIAFSSSDGTYLDIPSLHAALRAAEAESGGDRRIDLYASDACLMQMVEVAYEISDSARYIVGSSQVENYLGLPYRRFLFELNTGRYSGERERPGVVGTPRAQDEAFMAADLLPRIFKMSLEQHGLHGRIQPDALATVTMSAISSDALRDELTPALGGLADQVLRYLATDPMRAISVADALARAPGFMGGSQELGGFLALLESTVEAGGGADRFELEAAIAATTTALDHTVISRALGTRYDNTAFRALAMWLPVSDEELKLRLGDFSSSLFYLRLAGRWDGWLKAVFE